MFSRLTRDIDRARRAVSSGESQGESGTTTPWVIWDNDPLLQRR